MNTIQNKISSLFKRQTKIDTVLALNDETKIIIALSDLVFAKSQKVGFSNLTDTEKIFDCIYWLEAEVNNGGFHQYFFNTSGDHVMDTIKALHAIQANKTASLLKEAITVFPENTSSIFQTKRQEQLLSINEASRNFLNELDEKFYAYVDPIGTLLVEYIKNHKKDFDL